MAGYEKQVGLRLSIDEFAAVERLQSEIGPDLSGKLMPLGAVCRLLVKAGLKARYHGPLDDMPVGLWTLQNPAAIVEGQEQKA